MLIDELDVCLFAASTALRWRPARGPAPTPWWALWALRSSCN